MPVWIRRGVHRRICVANGTSERSPHRQWNCTTVDFYDEAPSRRQILATEKGPKTEMQLVWKIPLIVITGIAAGFLNVVAGGGS